MRSTCILLFLLLGYVYAVSQGNISGIVYYQNSGSRTVAGVQVSAFGCGSQYTTSSGMFQLSCPGKKAGQKIKLIIGNTDQDGNAIEVVNVRELDWLRLPAEPAADPVEIIVCNAGQRDQAAMRFYGILSNAANRQFEKRLESIQAQLSETNLSAGERKTLIEQIDRLQSERDRALQKIEEQSQYIADINKDQASEMVKRAIEKIESEEDPEGALQVLEAVNLEEAYESAREKRMQAEAGIRQVIEGYKLRVKLLESEFKYGEIADCYKRIIEIHEANEFGPEELATHLNNLGLVLNDDAKYEEALVYQLRSMRIREEVLDPEDPDLARIYNNIAMNYGDLKEYDLALKYGHKCMALREEILGPKHPHLANTYGIVASLYEELKQYDSSLVYHQKSLKIRQEVLDSLHPDLATSYANMAFTYEYLGDLKTTLEYEEKALAIREKILPTNHPDLSNIYNNISITYLKLGEKEKALEYSKRALAIRKAVYNPLHPALARVEGNISTIYEALQEYDEAIVHGQIALDIWHKILSPKDLTIAFVSFRMGNYHEKSHRYPQAIEFYKKSIAIGEDVLDSTHQYLGIFYRDIGQSYAKNGQREKGLTYMMKYDRIEPPSNTKSLYWAVFHALAGDKEKTLSAIRSAIDQGFNSVEWLEANKHLDFIRDEPEYNAFLEELNAGQ